MLTQHLLKVTVQIQHFGEYNTLRWKKKLPFLNAEIIH